MSTINFNEISFMIISYVGTAKSNALIAIREAKKSNFSEAKKLIINAEKNIIEAEKQHMEIIQQESQGVKHKIPVIFMHAEDQLLTTQMIIEIAKEFVDLYQTLVNNNIKL